MRQKNIVVFCATILPFIFTYYHDTKQIQYIETTTKRTGTQRNLDGSSALTATTKKRHRPTIDVDLFTFCFCIADSTYLISCRVRLAICSVETTCAEVAFMDKCVTNKSKNTYTQLFNKRQSKERNVVQSKSYTNPIRRIHFLFILVLLSLEHVYELEHLDVPNVTYSFDLAVFLDYRKSLFLTYPFSCWNKNGDGEENTRINFILFVCGSKIESVSFTYKFQLLWFVSK